MTARGPGPARAAPARRPRAPALPPAAPARPRYRKSNTPRHARGALASAQAKLAAHGAALELWGRAEEALRASIEQRKARPLSADLAQSLSSLGALMLDREASRLAQLGGMARTDAPSMALVEAPGTSQAIATLQGHTDGVSCVAAPSADRVVSGSADKTVRVWDVSSGEAVEQLLYHFYALSVFHCKYLKNRCTMVPWSFCTRQQHQALSPTAIGTSTQVFMMMSFA